MHPFVRDLYKRFLLLSADYTNSKQEQIEFIHKIKQSFMKNKHIPIPPLSSSSSSSRDYDLFYRSVHSGRYELKQLIHFIQFKKYRYMKKQYNPQEHMNAHKHNRNTDNTTGKNNITTGEKRFFSSSSISSVFQGGNSLFNGHRHFSSSSASVSSSSSSSSPSISLPLCYSLRGCIFFGHHGYYASERALGQKFQLDLLATTSTGNKAGYTKQLEDTVDYIQLYNILQEHCEKKQYHLLETLGAEIVSEIFSTVPLIDLIELKIKKIEIAVQGVVKGGIGIELKRNREQWREEEKLFIKTQRT